MVSNSRQKVHCVQRKYLISLLFETNAIQTCQWGFVAKGAKFPES